MSTSEKLKALERLDALGDTPGSDVCGCTRVMLRKKCAAQAIDRTNGRHVECILAENHKHTHYWERVEGKQLLSASWYGPDDGLPVMIGGESA